MSADLYATRLYWCGHRGVAKLDGVHLSLVCAPSICGVRVAMVDYTPEVHVCRIMPLREGWREMEHAEIEDADRVLREMLEQQEP